jgi:3-oxoacyl-[acyl-carrier-protein] synthase-3
MKPPKIARIIGTGKYLPSRVMTNQDLEKMVETSDEWIYTRTGMKERRIAKDDEYTSDMGIKAAQIALEDAGLSPDKIDLVLVATLTPDYVFPSTACLIQTGLKLSNAAALDVQAACSGYVYALSVAKAFIESGLYQNILIVASEKLTSIVNYKDRNTCVLFGDGAAACVVSHQGKGLKIREICLGCDGEHAQLIVMPGGGSRFPTSEKTIADELHYIKMEGKEVFKHAVRRMEAASKECLERAGLREDEISWLVPHQANMRIIEAIAKRFQVPMERVYMTIHKYGNTSASSIGIALDELLKEHKMKEGENLLLTAFGAGLTWGASLLTYGENHE